MSMDVYQPEQIRNPHRSLNVSTEEIQATFWLTDLSNPVPENMRSPKFLWWFCELKVSFTKKKKKKKERKTKKLTCEMLTCGLFYV